MSRLLRAAVVVAAAPAVLALSVVANRFDARADCLPMIGVAATGGRTYGIRTDHTLWHWGRTVEGNPAPAEPDPIDRVTRLSANAHMLALRDGFVWSWGDDSFSQLGDGFTPVVSNVVTNRPFPLPVSGVPPAVDVSAGSMHSLVLSQTGHVWSWGWGYLGRLGDGTQTSRSSPIQVPNLSGVVDVSAGYYHSLALKSDGTVVGWGSNEFGQVGDGTRGNYRTVPTPVIRVTGAVAVEAASSSSIALTSIGAVWQWDSAFNGPAQVSGLSGIVAIAAHANSHHFMALKNDGTVWTWGQNWNGQIGDGTTNFRAGPYKVLGLPKIVRIAAGSLNSFAVAENGEVWGWGYNGNGQLGDGTKTDRYTPVRAQHVVQCFVPHVESTPTPVPTVSASPVPTPSVSPPPGTGGEAPVAECRFARYQGQLVYGGYAIVSHDPPPSATTVKCTVTTGNVYKERAGTAPGSVAVVTDTVAAPPEVVTICTYAEAVYEGGRVVSTSSCVES
jgi:alpha-tubulin suppressor-like RCC1 family protein